MRKDPALLFSWRNPWRACLSTRRFSVVGKQGEYVMEVRVQLKVCEACGCLWFRPQPQAGVYCHACETKFRDFPAPETRKRRGRKGRLNIWAVAEFIGGAE